MELEKGKCFCCGMTEVISEPPRKKIEKILFSLFPDKIFNINALKNCACLLKLCPTCLHKLILLKEANEDIQPISKASDVGINFCMMCGKECLTFKISNSWNHFKKISEDFPLLFNAREIVICSGCIFYLDTRNTVKIKLCSKYPQLKKVPKLKLNLREVTIHSTPKDTKKKQIDVRNTVPIDIVSESEELKLDWSPLKGFKALKYDKLLKKSRLISDDSKFMNQILYIRINKNDSLSLINTFQHKNKKIEQIESVSPKSRRRSRNDQSEPSSLENSSSNVESVSETQSEEHTNNATIDSSRIRINLSKNETRQELFKEKNNAFFKIRLKKNKKLIKTNKKHVHNEENLHSNENNFDKKLVVNIQRHINVDQIAVQSFDEDNVLKKDDISSKINCVENINIETSMESLLLENESMEGPQEIINDTFKNNEHTINGLEHEQIEETAGEYISNNIDEPDDNIEKTIEASSNINVEEESEYKKDIMNKEAIPEGTVIAEEECDDEKTNIEDDLTKDEYTEENLMNPENDFTKNEYTEENLNEPIKDSTSDENCSLDDHFNEKSPERQSVEKKNDKFDDTIESKEESQDVEGDELDKIEVSGNNEDQHMADTDVSGKSGENENLEFNYENNDVSKENESYIGLNDDNHKQNENDVGLNEEDNVNIHLVLENAEITSELDEKDSNEKSVERNDLQELPGDSNIEDDDASTQYNKRKRNDSPEDSSSPDKKKKKVTFSDEILESPH